MPAKSGVFALNAKVDQRGPSPLVHFGSFPDLFTISAVFLLISTHTGKITVR